MSYARLPNRAELVERFFGIDTDGNVMVVAAYRFRAQGDKSFMYYIVRCREVDRRTERGSRRVRWLPAPVSRETLDKHLVPLRAELAMSRERAHRMLGLPGRYL